MINEHKLANNVVIVFFLRISLGFCFCFFSHLFQWFPFVVCLKWTFARLSNYSSSVHALNLLGVHFKGKYLFLELLTTYLEIWLENVHPVFRVFYCCDRKYAKPQFCWKRFLIQKDDKGRSIFPVMVALCIRETHFNKETSFYGDKAFKKDVMHTCLSAWEVLFILPYKLNNTWPRL